MDFDLTDEQRLLREAARDFVTRECTPELIRKHAATGTYEPSLWKKFAETGWLGIGIDPEYGGSGGDILDMAIVLEATATGIEAIGPTFATMCFGGQALAHMGNEEQKREFLPKMVDGDARFALSITEPGGGTDVLGAMQTTATKVDDGWRIDGSKMFTSASTDADYFVVVARTSPPGAKQAHGVSVFLMDAGTEGVELQPIAAMNGEDTNAVFYDGAFVPEDRLLGELDRGFYSLLGMLNNERLGIGALCIGWGEAGFEEVRQYALEREAFGGPIGRFQAIQHHLARMHLLIEQSRLMVYKAAWLQAQGRPCGLEATAAKSVAAENIFQALDLGMQILGGRGYTEDSDLNRYWRRVRLFRLAPVSNEMALNHIAEWHGMPRSF